jgi:V/A-type H+-transporting ATPase subunit D
MRNIASGIRYDHKVSYQTRVAAGIRIPTLEIEQGEFKLQYGFAGTDSLVDQTMNDFLLLLEVAGKLAELESSVWLLARELKKTQRQVNALEHIFIPDYKETLKYIEQVLESKELDSFFTMKLAKKQMTEET